MFSSSPARFTWISMQIKVTTVAVFLLCIFLSLVSIPACMFSSLQQLNLLGFQWQIKVTGDRGGGNLFF